MHILGSEVRPAIGVSGGSSPPFILAFRAGIYDRHFATMLAVQRGRPHPIVLEDLLAHCGCGRPSWRPDANQGPPPPSQAGPGRPVGRGGRRPLLRPPRGHPVRRGHHRQPQARKWEGRFLVGHSPDVVCWLTKQPAFPRSARRSPLCPPSVQDPAGWSQGKGDRGRFLNAIASTHSSQRNVGMVDPPRGNASPGRRRAVRPPGLHPTAPYRQPKGATHSAVGEPLWRPLDFG